MSIVIHHGHPGSFKSFGVLQRHAIPALQPDDSDNAPFPDGRTIVTNIRGFDSIEKVEKAMGVSLGDKAAILHVDTEGREAKAYMARWFHWAPPGAMIIIDEAQAIYPAKRKDFKPENLDYPGGPDQAKEDERPVDIFEAYDMHRHYNWDVFLCTPNISKVHADIRQSAQVAFRHYSMGELLPWKKGKWREVEHDPENNGKAKSHAYGVPKEYKAVPAVFRTYQSTKTGEHQSNQGPQSIFKDKRVVAYLLVAGTSLSIFLYLAVGKFLDYQEPETPVEESQQSPGPGGPDVVPDGDSVRTPEARPQNNGRVNSPQGYAELWTPRVKGVPHSAPVYDDVYEVKDFPRPQCIVREKNDDCRCYTQQATPLDIPEGQCREIVANGYWDPTRGPDTGQQQIQGAQGEGGAQYGQAHQRNVRALKIRAETEEMQW